MKIETDTSEIYHGDSIAIKTQENGNNIIYAGRINTVEMHDIVDVGFTIENDSYEVISTDTDNKWIRRFLDSNYKLYLRAEVMRSGKIKISGI
jgi:hypothetical protein